jgi:CBS domain-containing protein
LLLFYDEGVSAEEATMRKSDPMMETKPLRKAMALHLMERAVAFFKKETKCDALLSAMVNGNFGSVPIVDGEMRLIGIVSEYDLLDALLAGVDVTNLSAEEIMKHPHSISIDCPAMEIGRFIQQNHLIHIPVVDRNNRLVGMVARRDLLNGYLEELLGPNCF